MYTPEISGKTSCGEYSPTLTDIQRQSSCDSMNVMKTMQCLYDRNFKPLYTEILNPCACISCYTPSIWSRIVKHASNMNTNVIWNDIIKRWEPVDFDQNFSEEVDTINNYEFRNYNSIYSIEIDESDNSCLGNCPAMNETEEGSGFTKAHKGLDLPSPCPSDAYERELKFINS